MITRFRVPPFVATLAMLTIARGVTKLYTGGEAITGLGDGFVRIGSGRVLGIPNQVWIAAGIVLGATVLLDDKRLHGHLPAIVMSVILRRSGQAQPATDAQLGDIKHRL